MREHVAAVTCSGTSDTNASLCTNEAQREIGVCGGHLWKAERGRHKTVGNVKNTGAYQ